MAKKRWIRLAEAMNSMHGQRVLELRRLFPVRMVTVEIAGTHNKQVLGSGTLISATVMKLSMAL